MRLRIMAMMAAFLAPLLFAQSRANKNEAAPSGNAGHGRKIFADYGCYECHGREGQGGQGTGPRIAPRPIPFDAFDRYVRHPTGQMPPYTAKVVSAQDLADIYAFLRSRPEPPPVKSLLQLSDQSDR